MKREIKKKKIILEYRKPFRSEALTYIEELNLVDWIHSSMYYDGSALTRQGVLRILKGEYIIEATVEDHLLVGNYHRAIKLAYDLIEMEMDLDQKRIFQLYGTLTETEHVIYRKTNPILVEFDYNPPHPQELEEQMNLFNHWLAAENCDHDPILKAAYLHNKFIEIYPFEEYCEATARLLMNYQLIRYGFPPVALNLRESEYHKGVIQYLKREDVKPIYEALEQAVYNKLELMLQITKYE